MYALPFCTECGLAVDRGKEEDGHTESISRDCRATLRLNEGSELRDVS